MRSVTQHISIYSLFMVVLVLLFLNWQHSKNIRAKWSNVPPVPSQAQNLAGALGDTQLAYRTNAIMLTNIGSTGGQIFNLAQYDYGRLTDWFFLQDKLGSVSRYSPYLATYYYASVEDPQKVRTLLPYIEYVGMQNMPGRWPYMVQAVFLAKHMIKDLDLALRLAQTLALTPQDDAPEWLRQMPAFIYMDRGQKEEAYDLLKTILATGRDTLEPEELFNIVVNLCERVLSKEEAAQDPLCQPLRQNKEP